MLATIANYPEAGIIEIYDNFNDNSFLLNNLGPPDASCILTKDTHYSIRLFDTKQGWTMEHPYFSLEWTVSRGIKDIHPDTIQFVIPREAVDTKRWEVSFLKVTGNGGEGVIEQILTLTPFKIRYDDAYINYNLNSHQYIDLQMVK